MVRAGSYYQVVSNKKLKGSGLVAGNYVYVNELKPAPIKANDPYLQRIFVLVILVDKETGFHHIPHNRSEEGVEGPKIYLVDPRYLEPLREVEQLRMAASLQEFYENKNE